MGDCGKQLPFICEKKEGGDDQGVLLQGVEGNKSSNFMVTVVVLLVVFILVVVVLIFVVRYMKNK